MIPNIELMKNSALQKQAAQSQMNPELQEASSKLSMLERQQVPQPQSALYYFDLSNREALLKNTQCTSAEEAFNLIKAKFDSLDSEQKAEYE